MLFMLFTADTCILCESWESRAKLWLILINYLRHLADDHDGGLPCSRQWPKDPEGMRCVLCLAFFETFIYQGRLAAIFELMKCNLRTALAKYGVPWSLLESIDLIVGSMVRIVVTNKNASYGAENRDLFLGYGKAGKGLPLLPTVRDFGWQLLCALRLLRTAGLIHCDVKPENLLLAPDSCGLNS